MNPRIQVEHTVTEQITGIDLVRSQILIAQGEELHGPELESAAAGARCRGAGFAVQCRVTTEDPENKFMPNYGKILTFRSAGGFWDPARCRHGRRGRGDHAVLRFAAGEDHGQRADL